MAFKILNYNIIDDTRNIVNAASVGVGTTTSSTAAALFVIGNTFATGISTASRFASNVAQGTAPISVASSTRVDTLNVQYLDGNDSSYYRNASNLNAGQVPGAQVTQSSGLTVTGNLSVSGNVTIGGTATQLNAQQLRITDRDITLGVTTDAFGNDVSTDTTANHGGIAIASTEGSPILNIPQQAGINTDPSTYKQLMWIKQGNYSGMGTDAWVFNYAVSIGNTASVQNLSRLTVGAGFTVFDTYLDATDIRARNITAVTNINASGIVTAAGGFNASSSSDYEINGTSVLNSTTLGTNVVNSSLTSVGTLTTLNATSITNTNINSSGIHTAATFNVGVTTVLATVNSQIRLAGIATIDATTKATLERELAFAPNQFDDLSVTGIATFTNGPVLIGTATSTGTLNQRLQVTGGASFTGVGASVGIGTTTPQSPLDVNGNVRFRSAIVDNTGSTGTNNQILTAGPLGAGVTWATLNASSIGAISGVTVTGDSTTATPLYPTFTSATTGSITAVNVDINGLSYIPSGAGSLGIGTTSPTRTLDVNGEIRLRAGLYDSTNTLGTPNQVLTVGAGGSVTWQAVTSTGAISGITITDDTSTPGLKYPLFTSVTTGSVTGQFVDSNGLVYNTSTNCLGIGSLTPTSRLDIIGDVRVSGIVTAGDFNSTSDRKLKTNIQTITNPIEKVLQISGVTFNWKETGKATLGVIAQEIELVLPELVSDTDPKTVNYNGLIGLLIECVKDQQNQIDELKQITAKKTSRKPKNT